MHWLGISLIIFTSGTPNFLSLCVGDVGLRGLQPRSEAASPRSGVRTVALRGSSSVLISVEKGQKEIPSTSGAICEKPQGGAFAPPPQRGEG